MGEVKLLFTPSAMGYDRAITIFSPDGKLYQVEYAFEAVRKGMLTLGVRSREGVVLMAVKQPRSKLMESTEKIKKIDEHVGLAFAGLFGDARVLIDQARIYAQIHRLVYGEKMPVDLLVKRICDIKQAYTQHAGVRPFGVAFLFAGIDKKGPHLIRTDPGGSYTMFKADAIGANAPKAVEVLEREYSEDITLDGAIELGLKAVRYAVGIELSSTNLEMAIVKVEDQRFRILSEKEIEQVLSKFEQ